MGGGGQPRNKHSYQAFRLERQQGLYSIDKAALVRQSHNNSLIQKLYHEYLGTPLGEKSHQLLHTTYRDRKQLVKHTMEEIWRDIEERT